MILRSILKSKFWLQCTSNGIRRQNDTNLFSRGLWDEEYNAPSTPSIPSSSSSEVEEKKEDGDKKKDVEEPFPEDVKAQEERESLEREERERLEEREKEEQAKREREAKEREVRKRIEKEKEKNVADEERELKRLEQYQVSIPPTTEEGILLATKLETFTETLSLEESEKLASFLTVPFLRIPLVLNFFADNRLGLLLKEDLKVVLETVLFQTYIWTPSALNVSAVPASLAENTVMGSRYGLLSEVQFALFLISRLGISSLS